MGDIQMFPVGNSCFIKKIEIYLEAHSNPVYNTRDTAIQFRNPTF